MVPFLAYDEIARHAEDFLREHASAEEIPVDIESIVEFRLGMDIVPVPGLQRDHGIEGYISRDMGSIHVDEGVLINVPVRYRYTLAHEVGHLVLHSELLKDDANGAVDEWSKSDYDRMEFQGYCFGGSS